MLRAGIVGSEDVVSALAHKGREAGRLPDRLKARGLIVDHDLLRAEAQNWRLGLVDPQVEPPDPRLVAQLGPADCLRFGLVPWRRAGDVTVVATSRPGDFPQMRSWLKARLGPVCPAFASPRAVEAAVLSRSGAELARAAETCVAPEESCRSWGRLGRSPRSLASLAAIAALAFWAPVGFALGLLAAFVGSLFFLVALKVLAMIAALSRPRPPSTPADGGIDPIISIIVALYRESDIAPRLVARLARLDYPEDRLDVLLVVEEDDQMTRAALAASELPRWMRVITVPRGTVRTKPRALNFALLYARGAIVGVYDAEDAPDPDQLKKVVAQFERSGPEVACLQGVLDYYNPTTNWLSRCFTIEYAGWFRLILPGVARLGLVVPLGGTTLFFRRSVLEELGGWDAHNVTEDADLGLRLARHGYRTEFVDTVTAEEANCRALPWIKQRSRWLKGYMMTWAVHMRNPALLLRQLGPWRFLGVQVLFLGTIAHFLLSPLAWTFWLVPFGFHHPLMALLPAPALWAMIGVFILSEAANLAIGIVGLRRSGQKLSLLWIPTMKLYFPLASLAAYKGLWELATRPFYWDKTAHGLFDPPAPR